MRFLKNKSAAAVLLTCSLFINTFTLFSMLCGPVYAGYSIFEFNFTNNTDSIIQIKRGTNIPNYNNNYANPPALAQDTIAPEQTSKKFVIGQRGGNSSILAMHYKWYVYVYKNNQMLCSSVILFQLTHLGAKAWRYGTIFRKNKKNLSCKQFKGVGAKHAYYDKHITPGVWLGDKTLPNPCNTGYPKHYLINIPLGNKSI